MKSPVYESYDKGFVISSWGGGFLSAPPGLNRVKQAVFLNNILKHNYCLGKIKMMVTNMDKSYIVGSQIGLKIIIPAILLVKMKFIYYY